MCRPGTKTVFEANKQQTLEISCRMVANPSTDLAFSWTFNNSINTMDIPVSLYTATIALKQLSMYIATMMAHRH